MSHTINNLKVDSKLLKRQRDNLLQIADLPNQDGLNTEELGGIINMLDEILDAIEVPQLQGLTDVKAIKQ